MRKNKGDLKGEKGTSRDITLTASEGRLREKGFKRQESREGRKVMGPPQCLLARVRKKQRGGEWDNKER